MRVLGYLLALPLLLAGGFAHGATYNCSNGAKFELNDQLRDQVSGYGNFQRPANGQVLTVASSIGNSATSASTISEWRKGPSGQERMYVSMAVGDMEFEGFMTSRGHWSGWAGKSGQWQPITCTES